MTTIDRSSYASMFGPTAGDRVRLGDTALLIEVEKDFTNYGEEVKFGGGKVIRDGMGQSQLGSSETVDLVITNALILDHWGIVKADIGIDDGRIVGIGKAGNPDIQDGVSIVIGPGTEVVAGEGQIVTAGGIDLQDIDMNSMESRKCKGLYFAGEVLDIDGVTGGFNFQHCWTSGWIAGKSIAKSLLI